MKCPTNENYVEGFGFLKGLLKLPKMFSEVPNVLKKLLTFFAGVKKGIEFFGKI